MGLFPPAPRGGSEVDYGYKGKGVLIHFLSDRNGHPIAACTTSAKGDERKMVLPLITKTTLNQLKRHVTLTRSMIILEADRGYDATWLRQKLLNIEIFPMIPYRGKKKAIHQEAYGGKNNSVDKEESKEDHLSMGKVIRKLGIKGHPCSDFLLDEDFSEIGSSNRFASVAIDNQTL